MIKIAHLARRAEGGKWQIYVEKPGPISALFFADTKADAVREAVTWAGDGDPLKTLNAVQDGLQTVLGDIHVKP